MNIEKILQQKQSEDSIRQENDQSLSIRAERYLKVKPHGIVPYTKFAPASAEVGLLFRDGHFYGCIALTQAVAEAIVRFLCQKNSFRAEKKFENNVLKLNTRGFISEELKNTFSKLWEKRDDYHHLNSSVEIQREELEDIAYEKVICLKKIESEVFKFSVNNGKLFPETRRYWELNSDGTIPVFLRLNP